MFPSPALVLLVLSKFLAEYVKGQIRHSDSGDTMLDRGSLASHSSQHVGRCPSMHCPIIKDLVIGDVSGRPGAQGSAISAFNPLVAH